MTKVHSIVVLEGCFFFIPVLNFRERGNQRANLNLCAAHKKKKRGALGMGNFIQSLPDVITVGSTKKSAKSIEDFKNAVKAANRNASAGIATEVEQAVEKGGNVLINMVNQHCYFDECTNTETLVGRRGCADYSSNANNCKQFCAEQRAKCADPNTCPPCDCPDAATCEKPILDIMWGQGMSQKNFTATV